MTHSPVLLVPNIQTSPIRRFTNLPITIYQISAAISARMAVLSFLKR
jgi:hypothetical protein